MSQAKKKKKQTHSRGGGSGTSSSRKGRLNWMTIVALILMLGAIFSYVATLDEGDPEALPTAEDGVYQ